MNLQEDILQILNEGLGKTSKRDEEFKKLHPIAIQNAEIKQLNEFDNKENFDKSKPVTQWERQNTLDC